MKARVTVTLKTGVLDPQGQAIEGALKGLGFGNVLSARQGKIIDLELSSTDEASARQEIAQMAEKLLANLVIENYAISFLN